VLNPVLQFDEFGLQCKKMLKIFRALDRRRVTGLVDFSDFLRQGWLGHFELKIFVQRVSQLCLKPIIAVRTFVHFSSADGKPLAESKLRPRSQPLAFRKLCATCGFNEACVTGQ
jgi:hypothetical protein